MAETYTSGVWVVKPGEEEDFVAAWKEFVTTGTGMPGSGTFRLVRDVEQANRFMSFARWESFDAQEAWRQSPGFAETLECARSHCEDFHTFTYEFVAGVS
jgi:heme-degrading monooxygenase HmoA